MTELTNEQKDKMAHLYNEYLQTGNKNILNGLNAACAYYGLDPAPIMERAEVLRITASLGIVMVPPLEKN